MADTQSSQDLPGLPYDLPKDLDGRVIYLAKLLDLDIGPLKRVTTEQAAQVLTEVVLYHHLDRFEQRRIMKHIRSLPGPVSMKLMPKITDPIWNPSLGLWALPTPELNQRLKRLETIHEFGQETGLTVSAIGIAGLIAKLRKGASAGSVLMVLIWGFFAVNEQDKEITEEEVDRRTEKRYRRFQGPGQ